MPHILLTGFKGCGKTTVGRRLAALLDREFLDLDEMMEDVYADAGPRLSFRDIYRRLGPAGFRELELKTARLLVRRATDDGDRGHFLVIALGGGAIAQPATREVLKPLGCVVYLKTPPETMLQRVRRNGFPAYIQGNDPEAEYLEVMSQREPVYAAASDRVVSLGNADPEQAARLVMDALKGLI